MDIQEKDFKVSYVDDIEIYNYVKLMISSLNYDISNKMIKEVIACSNMILRKHLGNKISLRFDPLNIFKKLKKLIIVMKAV